MLAHEVTSRLPVSPVFLVSIRVLSVRAMWCIMALSSREVGSTVANGDGSSSHVALERSDFTYTSQYCEENVYMLCKKLRSARVADQEGSNLFVVFISNENRQVPLWNQKASKGTEGLVIWDYHVICVQKTTEKDTQFQVWDLDTVLPFPVPLHQYITEAIRPSLPLHRKFRRLFRLIHAPIFLHYFASDRRHMRNAEGKWIAPPPPHNCIIAEDGTVHNLDVFISMTEENVSSKLEGAMTDFSQLQYGIVVDERKLEEFFIKAV